MVVVLHWIFGGFVAGFVMAGLYLLLGGVLWLVLAGALRCLRGSIYLLSRLLFLTRFISSIMHFSHS